ncbi:type II toxin-antitoxin system RelE/ParE family toxin [Macrococcus lamae]|uniref:Type II toxin-antitoxin system RelE/ParE family toxin n=1 Tax=Macrococcus lamae TaxID=198484 RepID=A0A4R6BTI8_9STAP|nr:type II toxin-antitoxin system RelE/ParE family toxin [Macrococcus lamae]TDM07920.1 type II toxin-antitoxin system RelE/ParE family toxin [Macrococcus lamae]
MKKIEFQYAKDSRGNEYFFDLLDSLPDKQRVALVTLISKIEKYGLQEAIKNQWVAKLDKNLYEIRSKQGSNIQRGIYFHLIKDQYVITHGFTKKTQKTPQKEINKGKLIRNKFIQSYKLKGVDNNE